MSSKQTFPLLAYWSSSITYWHILQSKVWNCSSKHYTAATQHLSRCCFATVLHSLGLQGKLVSSVFRQNYYYIQTELSSHAKPSRSSDPKWNKKVLVHKVKTSWSDSHLGLLWHLSSLLLNPFPESLHFGEWRGAKSQLFVGFSPEGTTRSTRNLKTCSSCKMRYFQKLILPHGFLICGEIEWTALEHLHDASFSIKAHSGSVWHSKHTMQCYVSSMSQFPNKASQTSLHLKKP